MSGKEKKAKYYLKEDGRFVIENYNLSKPFANFFPGIAGKYGIPMWVFYVNRGQAISSFGIKDKDHSILEFFPANKAWQLTSSHGFRTFIKTARGKKISFYEPFNNNPENLAFTLDNKISLSSHGLELDERNLSLGLEIKVKYFTIPNDSFAGLSRIVTIKNISKSTQKIQLLDGLPQIIPFGTANLFLKKLGRTIEAWMKVTNLERGVPFYKLDVDPTDRPEVVHINEGNFYLSFFYEKNTPRIIKPIVDPEPVFGQATDFSYPYEFRTAASYKSPKEQITESRTPCGFTFLDFELSAGQEKAIYSVIGNMRSKEALNSSISKITRPGYLAQKEEENKKLIEGLESDIKTESGSKEFDLYAGQTYLDNIMRGGYPTVFKTGNSPCVFYLYSRKHGDLERDYNKFQLQPAYFSQGNGNYRDVNQNRRCDIWFNPEIADENIKALFNLIQADGFNPLVVKGASFTIKDALSLNAILGNLTEAKHIPDIASFLAKPFTPGEIILFIEDKKIKLKVSYDQFLNTLLSHSKQHHEAEHGEGFWTDHWHYNLDLLENYLSVFPEKLKELIFEKKAFTFYDNTETVKPRAEKYILSGGLVKQLHSVASDNAKKEMLRKRTAHPHLVRSKYGAGDVYQTTLINKILCVLANKLASLDPAGCGIEMEANKPNWFDALNGLPGLFGSSVCETFELKRLVLFIKDALDKTTAQKIPVTEEVHRFLAGLNTLINDWINSASIDKDYIYWDKSASLKEEYRRNTRFGFSGNEPELAAGELAVTLNNALKKLDAAIDKAKDKNKNIYWAYFINEVTDYDILKEPFIKPKKFIQKKLPLFLEGQMHALRISGNLNEAKKLYLGTKASPIYDKKLKMYKVTAPLTSAPLEIGRCRVFSRGWLENESIWLHMEYKYLLETLKSGLYAEFYEDFKNVLIPFQKPQAYGRNILENSSFLVSSAFPDKKLHGNGFVARLSGSTAEFINIWLIMNVGQKPFFLNEKNELNLKLSPILSGWLFNRKGTYSFNFLSNIKVTYHNPKRKNTFGKNAAKITKIILQNKSEKPIEIPSDTIPAPYAGQIRSYGIEQIDAYLE